MKNILRRWLEIPDMEILEHKIASLERDILALNGGHKPNKRCDARYGPLANVYAVCSDCGWQVGFHKIVFEKEAA